jgi:RND family efflux transporter MFP subunit
MRARKQALTGLGGVMVAVAVLATGCGRSGNPQAKADPAGPAAAGQTVRVSTAPVVTRQVMASVQVTGSFVAEETSDVAPPAAGRVTETPVNIGDFVREGQILAKLDDRDAQLRLQLAQAAEQQAEASLRQAQSRIGLSQGTEFDPNTVPEVLSAKAAYESAQGQAKLAEADAKRYDNLIKTGDVSRSTYEKAKTAADTAAQQTNAARQQYEAALNSARQNFQGVLNAQASLAGARAQTALARKAVEDTIIHAPFAGYVSARPIAAGSYVALTAKIATLLRITPIKLDLQVPEASEPQLRIGSQVEARVPGYPDRLFRGSVSAINPAVDPNSRTVSVEVKFTNEDIALKPGMFASARILLQGRDSGIFLPRAAILTDPSTSSSQVFFIRDGKARVAVVQLGASDGDLVQILSGVSPEFVVATNHLQELYDGESVQTEVSSSPAAGVTSGGVGKGQ